MRLETLLILNFHPHLRVKSQYSEEKFRIGIIAPYRAQADLIDKLLAQGDIPEGIDLQAGTIHGFQGDECDILLTVFNPPPKISASTAMFLNRKNIINVAISRARDYLVVLMPDDQTEGVDNLFLVKSVEHLMQASDDYIEYASQEIEQKMFGSRTYIEDNAFSTSHQSVNVYGLPETYYEIRSEENAVDIQIHKEYAGAMTSSARHVTKDIPRIPQMQIAEDGWDSLEITQLVRFFRNLAKVDANEM